MEYLGLVFLLPLLLFGNFFDGSNDDTDIDGTETDDTLTGDNGGDDINGHNGNDLLDGAGGDDSLRGGDGDDVVEGGTGNDDVRGGDQSDVVLGFNGDDTLYGGSGDDLALGEAGNDEIWLGAGDDFGWVDNGFDAGLFETGQRGDDTIHGDSGDDNIFDYDGSNSLYGGDGDDIVVINDNSWYHAPDHSSDRGEGGNGDDNLSADLGDTMNGGAGADNFGIISYDPEFFDQTDIIDEPALIEDFNGADDSLTMIYWTQTSVDPNAALTAETDAESGDVTLSFDGINLVILTNPANFNLADVQFDVA